MTRDQERQVVELADSYMAGRMSRRTFIARMLALGLTVSAAGSILAACTTAATTAPTTAPTGAPTGAPSGAPSAAAATIDTSISGKVRYMLGPQTDREEEYQQVIIEAFNKIYPNIEVTLKLYDWGTAQATIQTSAESGAHDVYLTDEGTYSKLTLREDLFADISKYVDDPSYASEKAHFLDWERVVGLGPRVCGLPHDINFESAMWVNLALLEKAGYDAEGLVKSRDSFRDAIIKMTNAPDVYGLAYNTQPFTETYNNLILNSGTDILTEDLKAVAFETPDVVASTQWWVDLLLKDKAVVPLGTYDYSTVIDAFAAQKVAIFASDTTVAANLKARQLPFDWVYLPWPGGKARRAYNDLGLNTMGAKTPTPDAAWAMMSFWASGTWNAYFNDQASLYPVRDDAVASGWGEMVPKQVVDVLDLMMEAGASHQVFEQWGDCEAALTSEFGRAMAGEITAEESVKSAAAEVNKIAFGQS